MSRWVCDSAATAMIRSFSFRLAVFSLVGLDHADDARLHQTSHECRLVHQDKSINRVAIFGDRAGDGTEIEWEYCALRQDCFERISFTLVIVSELVAGTFRRVDDNVEAIRFRIERRQFL